MQLNPRRDATGVFSNCPSTPRLRILVENLVSCEWSPHGDRMPPWMSRGHEILVSSFDMDRPVPHPQNCQPSAVDKNRVRSCLIQYMYMSFLNLNYLNSGNSHSLYTHITQSRNGISLCQVSFSESKCLRANRRPTLAEIPDNSSCLWRLPGEPRPNKSCGWGGLAKCLTMSERKQVQPVKCEQKHASPK